MNKVDTLQIVENVTAVREKIAIAAARAGRRIEEITLVAVSKTHPAEAIMAAVSAGITDIGESRMQEAAGKIDELGHCARWHLIGHLQSNKAALAVKYFDMIQSLDSVALAEKVAVQARRQEKEIDCLIEVNSSGEDSKFGFAPEDTLPAAECVASLSGLHLCGLMTIGPWTTNEGCIKKAFDFTRELFVKLQSSLGAQFATLSMGMSSDYETAIAAGSNMVRVGTAIFGKR